jgi:hypothetical protein
VVGGEGLALPDCAVSGKSISESGALGLRPELWSSKRTGCGEYRPSERVVSSE